MSTKVFLASVLVSLVIMAPLAYFILPMLYPNMKGIETDEDEGIVLQSIYEEFETVAYIEDYTLKYELIDATEVTITTQGESFLAILFTMQAIMTISSLMVGSLAFDISLAVEGVGNRTLKVVYTDVTNPGSIRQMPVDVTINFVTNSLIAGNYTVGVYWRSETNQGGASSLVGYNVADYMFPRSLWVQEMKA
ncbi:MAG: hypothetical protein H7645_11395 [Candidatus Heimdallarchaeota archaeon]|nr:hypothetical protein [Candidatus Heimdallarchaeota archaeon]MCK4770929.1 hypothetical protein [Candidatus Heimdallarchaeota archaeon]